MIISEYDEICAKTYIDTSTIFNVENSNKGLFAKVKIKNGEIIEELKGKLRRPNENITMQLGYINVFFNDGYFLECLRYKNPCISHVNDPVKCQKRRKLTESLRSNEPFYSIHPNATKNAEIVRNHDTHRAFLMAITDIEPNNEIFRHHGFEYNFEKEIEEIGFEQEEEIENNGYPDRIFEYPAFIQYVKELYPNHMNYKISFDHARAGWYLSTIYMNYGDYGDYVSIRTDDYSKIITRETVKK